MQPPTAGARVLHRGQQIWIRQELAVFDHHVDLRDVHVDDSSGANVQMTNFAVSHLSRRKANIAATGVHERAGEVAQQDIIVWLAR